MGQLPLIHLEAEPKIQIFNNAVIVATTGAVGFTQRLHFHIEAAIKGGVFTNFTAREATANIPKRFLPDLQESNATKWGNDGLRFGGLIAAAVTDGPFLAEFGTTDFQPEIKTGKLFFVSMGSGQMLADPFLAFVCRVLWGSKMPDVDHGKFGVYWVLAHTIKLAPGQVGLPIRHAGLHPTWACGEAAPSGSKAFAQSTPNETEAFLSFSPETA
jgi:hypothetical protein